MLLLSTNETAERWPEKSAGVLEPCGQIALIFLDFFVLLYQDKRTFKSDCIDRNENKNAFAELKENINEKDSPLSIYANPNPAKHYVEFFNELSEIDTGGIIIITDINGKQIQLIDVNQTKGAIAWDPRGIQCTAYIREFLWL